MIKGYIFQNTSSEIEKKVADSVFFNDFVTQILIECGAQPCGEWQGERLCGGDGYLLLANDIHAISVPLFTNPPACNIRLCDRDGNLVGAFIPQPVFDDDIEKIPHAITVPAIKITSKNFADITERRFFEVARKLCEKGVFVQNGAEISPLAKIEKNTFISKDCKIGNIECGSGCIIQSSVILQSTLGNNVTVGPFAYIRPDCQIGDDVRIGDFVELKNSTVANNTKISHLTYVGDSTVGKRVNFGCGTVTVNYDGRQKHRTVIGNDVFIGCNTNLVAPITVGDNAFIAAGGTVTDDVPENAFVIARSRQTTKQDYMINKR